MEKIGDEMETRLIISGRKTADRKKDARDACSFM